MKYPVHKYQVETIRTVRDIYGTDDPIIPADYEPTGEFRPVTATKGDIFLAVDGFVRKAASDCSDWNTHPRIILKEKTKVRQVIFTEIGNGFPKKGQYFLESLNGCINLADHDYGFTSTIYKREEKLVEKQDNDL